MIIRMTPESTGKRIPERFDQFHKALDCLEIFAGDNVAFMEQQELAVYGPDGFSHKDFDHPYIYGWLDNGEWDTIVVDCRRGSPERELIEELRKIGDRYHSFADQLKEKIKHRQ